MNLYIPVLLGKANNEQQSESVAKFMLGETKKAGAKTELIDVRSYKAAANGKKLARIISRADGLIIVSPECNRSYSGELKTVLDAIYPHYEKKPVGICGVSEEHIDGERAAEQLREICNGLNMVAIRETVCFSSIQKLFGKMESPDNLAHSERVKPFFKELLWYAENIKKAGKKDI